jgi:hypothetical protein
MMEAAPGVVLPLGPALDTMDPRDAMDSMEMENAR